MVVRDAGFRPFSTLYVLICLLHFVDPRFSRMRAFELVDVEATGRKDPAVPEHGRTCVTAPVEHIFCLYNFFLAVHRLFL